MSTLYEIFGESAVAKADKKYRESRRDQDNRQKDELDDPNLTREQFDKIRRQQLKNMEKRKAEKRATKAAEQAFPTAPKPLARKRLAPDAGNEDTATKKVKLTGAPKRSSSVLDSAETTLKASLEKKTAPVAFAKFGELHQVARPQTGITAAPKGTSNSKKRAAPSDDTGSAGPTTKARKTAPALAKIEAPRAESTKVNKKRSAPSNDTVDHEDNNAKYSRRAPAAKRLRYVVESDDEDDDTAAIKEVTPLQPFKWRHEMGADFSKQIREYEELKKEHAAKVNAYEEAKAKAAQEAAARKAAVNKAAAKISADKKTAVKRAAAQKVTDRKANKEADEPERANAQNRNNHGIPRTGKQHASSSQLAKEQATIEKPKAESANASAVNTQPASSVQRAPAQATPAGSDDSPLPGTQSASPQQRTTGQPTLPTTDSSPPVDAQRASSQQRIIEESTIAVEGASHQGSSAKRALLDKPKATHKPTASVPKSPTPPADEAFGNHEATPDLIGDAGSVEGSKSPSPEDEQPIEQQKRSSSKSKARKSSGDDSTDGNSGPSKPDGTTRQKGVAHPVKPKTQRKRTVAAANDEVSFERSTKQHMQRFFF